MFAAVVRPAVRPLPDEQVQQLGKVTARRRQLVDMLGAEMNRRRMVRDPRLRLAALRAASNTTLFVAAA